METKRMRILTIGEATRDGLVYTKEAIEEAVEHGGWEKQVGFNFDPTSQTVAVVKSLSIQDNALYAEVELNDSAIQKVTEGWELTMVADYAPSGKPVTWCRIKELALTKAMPYSIGGHVREPDESPEEWEARMKGEVEDVGEQMHQAIMGQKAKRAVMPGQPIRTELEEAQYAVDQLEAKAGDPDQTWTFADGRAHAVAQARLQKAKTEHESRALERRMLDLEQRVGELARVERLLREPQTVNAARREMGLPDVPTGVPGTPEEYRAAMHSEKAPYQYMDEPDGAYRKRAMEWHDQEDKQEELKAAMDAHGALGGLPSDLVGRDDPNWYWRRAGMLGRDLALEMKAGKEKGGLGFWYHEARRLHRVMGLWKELAELREHDEGRTSESDLTKAKQLELALLAEKVDQSLGGMWKKMSDEFNAGRQEEWQPQVDRLAEFLIERDLVDPAQEKGAINIAIRVICNLMAEVDDRNARRLDRSDRAASDLGGEQLDHEQTQKVVKMLAHERDRWKELAELQAQVLPGDAVGVEWEMVQRMDALAAELTPAADPDPKPEDDDG